MKRILSILLSLCCLLTLLPLSVSAREETQTPEAPKGEQKKLVALTFDDGPSNYTATLLDGLKERGARVTFFMAGSAAEGYPNTVRRVYQEGHEIAQHSYSHPTFTSLSNSEIAWELNRTDNILNGHLGKNFTYLLRLPYGDCNSRVMDTIGRPAIFWTVDTLDWKYRNSDTVCQNIVDGAFDGAIILCHDIHKTTIPGALQAIDILQEQGYEFVTITELHRRRGASLDDGYRYYSCKPTGVDYGAAKMPEVRTLASYGAVQAELIGDAGTTVYYTTDGTDPVMDGQVYTGPIPVPREGLHLRAVAAYDLNGDRSAEFDGRVSAVMAEPPVLRVEDGCVVIENHNPNSDVRYTTDGTAPSEMSARYTAPIACFDGTLTYQVFGEGLLSEVYTIYVSSQGTLFLDVPTEQWYAGEVNAAVAAGIFEGTAPFVFEPETVTTRAMFVTVLYRLVNGYRFRMDYHRAQFPDVLTDTWYTEAVDWAAGYGIVTGYEDGTFRPDEQITREELCVIMDRLFLRLQGKNIGMARLLLPLLLATKSSQTVDQFVDAEDISPWALDSVVRMVECGIVQGNEVHCFLPQDGATRAEAAAVLLRARDYLKQ